MRRLKIWLFALVILVVGVGLRAWNVRQESPDFYEVSAALMMRQPAAEYMARPDIALCPPVFYGVGHVAWLLWPSALWAPRAVSLIAGALTPLLLFLVLRRPFGDRAASVAGFLLAFNPYHVFVSQSMAPAAFFMFLLAIALYFFFRVLDNDRIRDWVCFDILAVAMLYSHTGAAYVLATLGAVQLSRILLFPDPNEQRRVRKVRRLGVFAYNSAIVAVASVPWFLRIQTEPPWNVPYPSPIEVARVFTDCYFFGPGGEVSWFFRIVQVGLLVALVPSFIKTLRDNNIVESVPVFSLLAAYIALFGYAQVNRTQFIADRDGALALPFMVLALGTMLTHCNLYIRATVFAGFLGLFAAANVRQASTYQNLQWNTVAAKITETTPDKGLVVFWPDFTIRFGQYYFGDNRFQLATATDVLRMRADPSREKNAMFVVTRYPMRTDHLYTFPGALKHYATAETLWSQGRNFLIKADKIDWQSLALWFASPRTFSIVDQPKPNVTFFLFTPKEDEVENRKQVFRKDDFYWNVPSVCYEPDGRRVMWMRSESTELRLPVSLPPGSYVLKLHCDSNLVQPDIETPPGNRRVELSFRNGEDKRRVVVDKETVVDLPFSTDVEMREVVLHLEVTPLLVVTKPQKATFGLKIFSIAIEPDATEGPATNP